ncbi:MAG: cytochrome c [Gammaproteobacteria bacterium]|nr:cytochrome c [Gammaproteobacteria bacterium]
MHEFPVRPAALAATLFATAGAAHAADSVESAGKARYLQECAFCHGDDAKGNGPFALLLKKQPTDLTRLAQANGGQFPFDKVFASVDGRTRPLAHGTAEMPIWGQEWRLEEGAGAEAALRGRLLEVMMYLRSIQQK